MKRALWVVISTAFALVIFTGSACAEQGEPQFSNQASVEAESTNSRQPGSYSSEATVSQDKLHLYGDLAFHSGSSLLCPRFFHFNATLYQGWLSTQRLVVSLGAAHDEASQDWSGTRVFTSLTYHFTKPWELELGGSATTMLSGNSSSSERYFRVTQGRGKHHALTLRGSLTSDYYQTSGVTNSSSNVQSRELSFSWHQWVRSSWGFDIQETISQSSYYVNKSVQLGFFKEF